MPQLLGRERKLVRGLDITICCSSMKCGDRIESILVRYYGTYLPWHEAVRLSGCFDPHSGRLITASPLRPADMESTLDVGVDLTVFILGASKR